MTEIKTPWGSISSKVYLFPIYYLFIVYGFIYILPFGKSLVGYTWFVYLFKEDGPFEWLQFLQYFISSCFGFFIFYKSKKKQSLDYIIWLILSVLCLFIAAEEISWGERITGFTITSIKEISIQGETNLHNLPFFHNYLLDLFLQGICILFGWIGWRKWPYLTSLPNKELSLFFLFTASYFAYYDISWASTIEHIRNSPDQEVFELLLSTGFFVHFWNNLKFIKHKNY